MRYSDRSYERYRKAEEELANQLDERRRAADWETTRQRLRERGVLDEVETRIRSLRSVLTRGQRKRGNSLLDASLYAEGVIARLQDAMSDSSVGRPETSEAARPPAQ